MLSGGNGKAVTSGIHLTAFMGIDASSLEVKEFAFNFRQILKGSQSSDGLFAIPLSFDDTAYEL